MTTEAWTTLSGFLQASRVVPEQQRAAPGSIPLTVIGGFLGAGKTTLLNRLLGEPHGRRIAVLVNDFGRINIDAALIRARSADAIELANGCACCSVAGDLARTIVELAQREGPPEAIVIEASGLADPRGIAQVALANPALRLDGIVALADAETLVSQAGDATCAATLLGQVDAADVIILNKRDLVDDACAAAARAWLEARAPGCPVIEARHGSVPVEVVLGIQSTRSVCAEVASDDHAAGFESVSVTVPEPLDRARVRELLRLLPPGVVRAKGILCIADDAARRTVYQRVGARWSFVPEGPWDDGLRLSQLVVIALRGTLDATELERRLGTCSPSAHAGVTLSQTFTFGKSP
jgi:G3E family GTPase